MRFHLKKAITWSISVIVFLVVTFNFYNRSIWLTRGHTGNPTEWVPRLGIGHQNEKAGATLFESDLRNYTVGGDSLRFPATEAITYNKNILWPSVDFYNDDRIVNQLHYKPASPETNESVPLKTILLSTGFGSWQVRHGRQTFLDQNCNFNDCLLTDNRNLADKADAILFHHSGQRPWTNRPLGQIWILFMLESPYHTPSLRNLGSVFNWTATYRHDSDIVAPYEKFVPYDENVKFLPQNKSYAEGKSKKVAWFVSNCGARNTRKEYANELSKYIDVDIYGNCGKLKCPRRDKKCFEMLNTDYKFYLSFENSNCRDYITEKFFVTGLQHDVIPIVMGGAPEDYARAAPPHSFIHVDDFESPQALAQYLHKLDQNDALYNEYFRWKKTGTFINTFFWCRICAMLHETSRESHSYRDLEKWWRGDGVCIGKESWRNKSRSNKTIMQDYLD
ncbi:Alpha-(1 3)-fucosyltransferase 7 [Mactra antiquata]